MQPGALGVPIAGLEQGVFGFEHAAWALTEAPTTMTRKAEALMMFFIVFVVLLFCCFVVLPHSKTTSLTYHLRTTNQSESSFSFDKCDETPFS